MYNMEISFRIEIIILINIIFILMVYHTLYGCSKVGLLEGLDVINSQIKQKPQPPTIPKKEKEVPTAQMIGGKKEGFIGSNLYSDEPSTYTSGDFSEVDTSSWLQPSLVVRPGQDDSAAVKQFLSREEQPVPLPPDEMLLFANTPFKPECCPSTYSNSSGCACITGKQYNYLIQRGSNNVPYSDF